MAPRVESASKESLPNVWAPVLEQGLFTPKKMRVITAGAGHAGLMVAYKMRHEIKCEGFVEHVIYEKNHDVGGTWLENRYPGVACDVPAHIYTFSWEPNPNWSAYYCGGEEIFQYIKATTEKYDLARDVEFNSKVVEAIWNESRAKWEIKIDQQGTIISDECDVFIDASGALNKWKWPEIEGLKSFKGHMVHSAQWDNGYDFTGKRVAVIGNGSSAIQIVPELQKVAGHLTNYVRSPTWISAGYSSEFTPEGKNFKYSEEQRKEFRENPASLLKYRKEIENAFNHFFYALLNDSPEHKYITDMYNKIMRERLGGDEELAKEFIPKWRVGCRRLTPGEGYLEALQSKNCNHTWSPIEKITETGIVTKDGECGEFDAIICATGFDVSFVPRWKIRGQGGKNLDGWRDDPEAFLGIHAPNMPNYFIINGPNCPIGHGSLLAVMEWTAEYILKWVTKISTEDIKSLVVKPDVLREYNAYTQEFLKRTVWTSGCKSWYKNGTIDGKVTAMYAGSVIHYKELIDKIRGEDFDLRYNSVNRFQFMGNGKAQLEMEGGDLSFYVYK